MANLNNEIITIMANVQNCTEIEVYKRWQSIWNKIYLAKIIIQFVIHRKLYKLDWANPEIKNLCSVSRIQ